MIIIIIIIIRTCLQIPRSFFTLKSLALERRARAAARRARSQAAYIWAPPHQCPAAAAVRVPLVNKTGGPRAARPTGPAHSASIGPRQPDAIFMCPPEDRYCYLGGQINFQPGRPQPDSRSRRPLAFMIIFIRLARNQFEPCSGPRPPLTGRAAGANLIQISSDIACQASQGAAAPRPARARQLRPRTRLAASRRRRRAILRESEFKPLARRPPAGAHSSAAAKCPNDIPRRQAGESRAPRD
jgi:hypothetical protein